MLQKPAQAAPPSKPRSIAVYLFVLALVALVPAFGFSAILLQRNNEAQERVVETLITGSAHSILQSVERELDASMSTLKVIATSRSLLAGDFRAFYDEVKTALEGTDTYIYVLDQNFYTLLSTRADFGITPVLSNDIASGQEALLTRQPVVSDLVTGRVSGRKVFNVLMPVFPPTADPLLVGLSRDASTLSNALLTDKLPDGWNVAIVVLVVYWVTLQIGRSVRGLEADAKRLGTGQPVTARDYPITEIASISTALESASRTRQQAETEVRFLMRELAHRSKNQMTVIAAMAKQTARGADSVPEFVQNFEKRIFGLAKSTDLLLANGVVGVDLKELLAGQIDPLSPVDSGRVGIEGPPTRLNNQAAQILGMAAHELATNAVKHGAFRKESGRLDVSWARAGDSFNLAWRETVDGFTPPSDRRGFGTTVLENMVGRSLGAKVERIVHDNGLEWRFEIPVSAIDPAAAPEEPEKA